MGGLRGGWGDERWRGEGKFIVYGWSEEDMVSTKPTVSDAAIILSHT